MTVPFEYLYYTSPNIALSTPAGDGRKRSMDMNLKKKAVVAMILFVALPLALTSLVVCLAAKNLITEKTITLSEQSTEKLAQYLSHDIQVLSTQVQNFASDPTLISYLQADSEQGIGSESRFRRIKGYLEQNRGGYSVSYPTSFILLTANQTLYSSMFYSPYGESALVLEKVLSAPWYGDLSRFVYQQTEIFSDENWLLPLNGEKQIYFVSNITDGTDNYGILMLCINESYFSKLLENFQPTDNSATYLSSPQLSIWNARASPESKQLLGSGQGDSIEIVRKISGIQEDFGELYSFIPQEDIAKESVHIVYLGLGLVAFAALCTLLLLGMINHNIVTPVAQLNTLMKRVQSGDLTVRAEVRSQDDIGALNAGFNSMVSRLQDNIRQIQEEENAKRELELEILQAQINPHFIKNTLNTVRWMAELRKATGISKALSSFIKLTDYSFRSREPFVTVRQEYEYLQEYIYLQKLRYQNKFECSLAVDDALWETPILKLLLQPVLENSIVHGLAGKEGFGMISIVFAKREKAMEITVSDDGTGMDARTVRILQNGGRVSREKGGLGLHNVQERIRLHYGSRSAILFHSAPGQGTRVTLRLPLDDPQIQERRVAHAESVDD